MNCFVISNQKMQPEISRKRFPAKKSVQLRLKQLLEL